MRKFKTIRHTFKKINSFRCIQSESYHKTSNDQVEDKNVDNYIQFGNIRHHPPAVREWNNSVYNFNKNNQNQSTSIYNTLTRLIKGYFNFHNNISLARSKRMRYLRTKYKSKKLYISKPEVKQTNDKITITVYYFDKIKNSFSRKLFFYNKPKISNLLIKKSKIRKKKRFFFVKARYINKRIARWGIKYMKELKMFKIRNKFKNKFIEQGILFYFLKYILAMLNIFVFTLKPFSRSTLRTKNNKKRIYKKNRKVNNTTKLNLSMLKKEHDKLFKLINLNPKAIIWVDHFNSTFEILEGNNINESFLQKKLVSCYNSCSNSSKNKHNNRNIKMNFNNETNNKLWRIIKGYITSNTFSYNLLLKIFNILTLKINKFVTVQMYKKRARKIYKLKSLYYNNLIKMKKLLPALKMSIDNLYNKKVILNMVNLKYFYLNNDIYNQAIITKFRRKKSPLKILKRSVAKIKMHLSYDTSKKTNINETDKLCNYNNLALVKLPANVLQNDDYVVDTGDWLQIMLNRLYPYSFMARYYNLYSKRNKITNILNDIKYKKMLGIRVEASGRLTRRNKASRAVSLSVQKGNLKDVNRDLHNKTHRMKNISSLLLRNSQRPNTQYTFNSSKKRIGVFGIKTWISSK